MELKLYSIVIKVNSIVISVLAGILLFALWIVLIPIRVFYDMLMFLVEASTGESTYHNYVANSFIRYYGAIKTVYSAMMDKNNFKL